MRWDKDRLKSFETDNTVHLNESAFKNAFLKGNDRTDILSLVGSDKSGDFVRNLVDRVSSEWEFEASGKPAMVLHHCHLESKHAKEDRTPSPLGFGYPVFIAKEDDFSLFPVAAPIFIWEVNLLPSPNRPDTWTISRSASDAIRPNAILFDYLKEHFDLDLWDAARELTESGSLNGGAISAFCNNISVKLGIGGNVSGYAALPFPGPDELKEISEEPTIRFSGVLGCFNHSIIPLTRGLKAALENPDLDLSPSLEDTGFTAAHPFSFISPDPAQKNLVQKALTQRTTIGEGGPGTGKTTAALHAAINTLTNFGTCLIVAPDNKTLEKIQEGFNKHGLGRYSFVVNNPAQDLSRFVTSVKEMPKAVKNGSKSPDLGFKLLLDRCLAKHQKLEERQKALTRPVFGELGFPDTVGMYMRSSRKSGKETLSGSLAGSDFKFTRREYDILRSDIRKGERLFPGVGRMEHPLDILHEEIFTGKNDEAARDFTEKKVDYYRNKTRQLLNRYRNGIESYKDALWEHYENHAIELGEKADALKDKINEFAQVYGEDFKNSGNLKVDMYGVFSDTYYNIKEARKEVVKDYNELVDTFGDRQFFEYKMQRKKETEKIPVISRYLADFEEALNAWSPMMEKRVTREVNGLNSKSVMVHLDYDNRIGELEYAHDVLIEELNQDKLFAEWLSYDGTNLKKRMESLVKIQDLLETAALHQPEFDNYYPWRRHWLEMLPISKRALTALIQTRAQDWVADFDAWYFFKSPARHAESVLDRDESMVKEYVSGLRSLRNGFGGFVDSYFLEKQEKTLSAFKKNKKKMYSLLFGRKKALPLGTEMGDVMESIGEALPYWVPVLMMTTDCAAELAPRIKGNYDLVILDDAHRIPEATAALFGQRSSKHLILGDRHQSFFRDGNKSVMEHLVESGTEITPLYYQHGNRSESTLDFVNRNSYGNGIKGIRYFQRGKHEPDISLRAEDGRYDEEKLINDQEAQQVIRALTEIKPKSDGSLPKTALVTMTMEQRDHIHSYLLYIKQKRNPFCDIVMKLEEAGLRVFHYSELKEPFEVVVFSTTYGTIDLKGTLSSHFGDADRNYGASVLNLIAGNTLKKLIVCTSVKKKYVKDSLASSFDSAGSILKFLRYAALVSKDREEERRAFLERESFGEAKPDPTSESVFMTEVAKELRPYFEEDRLRYSSPLSEIGTPALTLMPKDFRQPICLVLGDTLDRNNPTRAYEYELDVMEGLKKAGYRVFKTKSRNWWKNPKKEARILASKLIKIDNTPVELLEEDVANGN